MPGQSGVQVWDDFTVGDWGRLGGFKAPHGSWSGVNAMRYIDGSIGPRPGMIDVTPAGLPGGALSSFGVVSQGAFGLSCALFAVLGAGDVYTWPAQTLPAGPETPGAAILAAGPKIVPNGGTPSPRTTDIGANAAYVAAAVGGVYKISDPTGGLAPATVTNTVIAGGSAGQIALYGQRMLVANTVAPLDRLFFSDAGSFMSYPAPNFVDVGDGAIMAGLVALRDRAVLFKPDSVYQLLGVPGVNDEIRLVGPARGLAVFNNFDGVVALADGEIWSVDATNRSPFSFDGFNSRQLPHLTAGATVAMPHGLIRGPRAGDLAVYSSGPDMLVRQAGAWTHFTLGVPVPGVPAGAPRRMAAGWRYPGVWFCQTTLAAGTKVYYLDLDVDRPASTADVVRSPGDASTTPVVCNIVLPKEMAVARSPSGRPYAPTGLEGMVRHVVIEGSKWNTGSASTNHFEMVVTAGSPTVGSDKDSNVYQFDEATTLAGATPGTGKRARVTFNLGEQGYGGTLQVRFSNVRGFSFDKVIAVYDIRPAKG